ncbi:MAG TPA: ester cyclase [Dehalococcoidia bacterium]|nr:ester cyclase [Dehalococcoidia bacterium]
MTAGETILKLLEAFNRHDIAAFAAFYASDAVAYDPTYPDPLRGRDAIRRDMEQFFRAFPDVHCEVMGDVLDRGVQAAVRLRATGTHLGPLATPQGEQPATGRPVDFHVAIFWQVGEDDLIQSEHRYFDMAGIMAQLGLMPTP